MAYKLYSVSEDSNTNDSSSNEQTMNSRRMSKLKEEFPVLEEQIQLKGIFYNTTNVL